MTGKQVTDYTALQYRKVTPVIKHRAVKKTIIATADAKVLFDRAITSSQEKLNCDIADKSCYELSFLQWVIANGFELPDYAIAKDKLFNFEESIVD